MRINRCYRTRGTEKRKQTTVRIQRSRCGLWTNKASKGQCGAGGAGGTAAWVKALVWGPADLRSIPGFPWWKERTDSWTLFLSHTCSKINNLEVNTNSPNLIIKKKENPLTEKREKKANNLVFKRNKFVASHFGRWVGKGLRFNSLLWYQSKILQVLQSAVSPGEFSQSCKARLRRPLPCDLFSSSPGP